MPTMGRLCFNGHHTNLLQIMVKLSRILSIKKLHNCGPTTNEDFQIAKKKYVNLLINQIFVDPQKFSFVGFPSSFTSPVCIYML